MVGKVTEERDNVMSFKYQNAAIYHKDSDCIEYVKLDGGVYYERIDDFLTLIKAIDGKETIGFKLKGFSYILQNHSKDFKLDNEEFSIVMKAFEVVYSVLGDILVSDPEVRAAYDEAVYMASNDNVKEVANLQDLIDRAA